MKTISTLLNEAVDTVQVYHGDDYGTREILIKNMWLGGNSQEGIGIYFDKDINIAKKYGKYISSCIIEPKKYLNSRDILTNVVKFQNIINILTLCYKDNPEQMYYLITDYGIYLDSPDEIKPIHIKQLSKLISNTEIRNFQVELVQNFNIYTFVNAWMTVLPNIHGLSSPTKDYFSIINTNIQVTPINF